MINFFKKVQWKIQIYFIVMEKQNRFLFILGHDPKSKDSINKKVLQSFFSFSEAKRYGNELKDDNKVVIALLMDQATQKIEIIKGTVLEEMKEILKVAAPKWQEGTIKF